MGEAFQCDHTGGIYPDIDDGWVEVSIRVFKRNDVGTTIRRLISEFEGVFGPEQAARMQEMLDTYLPAMADMPGMGGNTIHDAKLDFAGTVELQDVLRRVNHEIEELTGKPSQSDAMWERLQPMIERLREQMKPVELPPGSEVPIEDVPRYIPTVAAPMGDIWHEDGIIARFSAWPVLDDAALADWLAGQFGMPGTYTLNGYVGEDTPGGRLAPQSRQVVVAEDHPMLRARIGPPWMGRAYVRPFPTPPPAVEEEPETLEAPPADGHQDG